MCHFFPCRPASTGKYLCRNRGTTDLDFLEFLADWQSDQGEWIDPLEVQDMAQNEHSLPSTEAQSDD